MADAKFFLLAPLTSGRPPSRAEESEGLSKTPLLPSSLISSPVTGLDQRLQRLWRCLRVPSLPHLQAVMREPVFASVRLLPVSSPERRMNPSPCVALPRGCLASQGGRSHAAPSPPANPSSYRPQPPRALAITENAKHFFLLPLLIQTHLGFICLTIFHFLFWKVIRVLHVPFITKETRKRGVRLGYPSKE